MATDNLKYKEALSRIEAIVDKIENEEPDVDDLEKMIKDALKLIKVCKEKLKNTEAELNKALEDFE